MGGYGSGRRAGRATVEGCRSLKLDVNAVVRKLRPPLRGLGEGETFKARYQWAWTIRGDDAPWATVALSLALGRDSGEARLVFDIGHTHRRTGPQDQRVELESTPCHFGGRRWWWICPATGRRCATLYLPNGGTQFLSRGRGAYRLAYASQREDPSGRSHGRLRRLSRKLGSTYTGPDDVPGTKPKWMRWRTYDRMVAEWEDEVGLLDDLFVASVERLADRLGPRR
jgi:hypothetical protein